MISRHDALDLIARHGWQSNTPTANDKYGRVIPDSTFDAEMGVHQWYRTRKVYDWLGY